MQLFSVMMASVFFDKMGRKPFLLGGRRDAEAFNHPKLT